MGAPAVGGGSDELSIVCNRAECAAVNEICGIESVVKIDHPEVSRRLTNGSFPDWPGRR